MTLFVTNLNTGVKTKIFALFDTGSDREFLAGTAARQIDLKTHTKLTEVTTLRGPEVKETQMANFRIESLDGTYVCDVNDAIVDNLPVVDADIPPSRRDLSGYSHLNGVVENTLTETSTSSWAPPTRRRSGAAK